MQRRLSTLMKGSGSNPRPGASDSPDMDNDTESKISTAATTVRGEESQVAAPSLKVKHVDYYYSWWTRNWKYRNTSAKHVVEAPPVAQSKDGNDPWKDYLFVVVRTIPRSELACITVKIVVKSPYILKACKDVIQSWPGLSWNVDPLEMHPEIFLVFYEQFIAYRDELRSKKSATQEEIYTAQAVDLLVNTLANDYSSTLSKLKQLTSHSEIEWDLVPYILVPRTIFVSRCTVTGQPRVYKLRQWIRTMLDNKPSFQLTLESVDIIDRPVTQSVAIGRVTTTVYLRLIRGVAKIGTMEAYPIRYYHDETGMKEQGLREMVIERGKKWFSLFGIHHVQYDGVAGQRANNGQGVVTRHYVNSRIMVDRATFRRFNPSFRFPPPLPPVVEVDENGNPTNTWGPNQPPPQVPPPVSDPTIQPPPQVVRRPAARSAGTMVVAAAVTMESNKDAYEEIAMDDYTEEDYLLSSTLVYGFSLSDKIWLEFSVSTIRPVEWNETAFNNLVLPSGRKDLLKSLIEVHHQGLNFDDFIKGKGHGLIINLFGPPGVGKTFSAEATSEHVKRPLYIVGAGDLGTNANTLDKALEKVFNLATIWKAIVLIDEADVFLEQRSLKDLERNAMVAVFLRHVEYYRGILFLTTNRVKTFDEAFLSRIHVALHFTELSLESKIQVWTAFLGKVSALVESGGEITEAEVTELSKREINGRQIKNAVRTAQSLASAKGQKLAYAHVVQTLDAMEEFTREFEKAIAA